MTDDLYQDGLFQPDDDEFTKLPRKVIILWRIEILTTAVTLTAIAAAALGLLMPWWLGWDPLWALTTAVFPLKAAWSWSRLQARWQFTGYRLGEEEVQVRHGLLERSLRAFPYGRIQLVEVFSGFWARRLGLAHVSISIGVREHTSIGPVTTDESARLRSELMKLTLQKAVEL
ncbi:PH domain-containing protein [Streptomyces sp. NPDC002586]